MSFQSKPAIAGFMLLASASAAFGQTAAPSRPPQPAPQQAAPVPVPRTAFLANMDAEFRKMDADKNNVLTRTEIEQFQRMVAVYQAQARNRALFTQLDADRNGQLSPAEFAKLQTAPPPPNAAPVLAQADLNKDQSITLVEYRTAKLANFDRLDADKDGVVSIAEMKAGGIVK